MDFGKLLSVAQRNAATTEQKAESRYYSTKFTPPKKECKEKKLSANIKKFLAKKEQEERERAQEEKRKREELLAKRDPKAKRKIEKMLKVIKSANKSVLEDAIDTQDTALTLEGPDQPDEDDYGYTSNVASQFYQQLMEKYKNNPEEKKFKDGEKRTMSKEDIDRAKARVKDALNKAHEEEMTPKSRKRKDTSAREDSPEKTDSSRSGRHSGHNRYDPEEERRKEAEAKAKEEEERRKKKVKRPAGPAPPDFATLLKLAEQKQFEPIKVEVPAEKKEPERLMTKREKREYDERMAYLEQKKLRDRIRNDPKLSEKERQMKLARLNGGYAPPAGKSSSSGESSSSTSSPSAKPEPTKNVMAPNGRIPKLNSAGSGNPPTSTKPTSSRPDDRQTLSQRSTADLASKSKLEAALTAKRNSSVSQPPIREQKKPAPSSQMNGNNYKPSASSSSGSKAAVAASSRSGPSSSTASSSAKSANQPANGQKARPYPTSQLADATQKTRPFPPQDNGQQRSRPFPPPDMQRKRPVGGGAPPPKKRRPVIDSDSEYDSEMDDFIDDGDEEEDYSSHIRAIFGYDRSRYRDEDLDDRQMESSFAQQMREEMISKKIGIMEDLEDMRAEEEEKRQKALMKKKQKMKGGK